MAKKLSIPNKYLRSGKSFIKKIQQDIDKRAISSLAAFPKGVDFQGKEEKEDVILLVRKHPASLFGKYLLILAFLLAPIIFLRVLSLMGISGASVVSIGAGGVLIFILISISLAVDTFIKWFYSVNIVTSERIVDVDFNNVLFHSFSEAQLEQIQDVTHTVNGVMGSLFDYGTVYIQTAGTKPLFEFRNVPRPRDVQDVVLDLLEMKQKGEI